MVKEWLRENVSSIAHELVKINESSITRDTISGFGMKKKVEALIDLIRSALFPNIYDKIIS